MVLQKRKQIAFPNIHAEIDKPVPFVGSLPKGREDFELMVQRMACHFSGEDFAGSNGKVVFGVNEKHRDR